MRIVFGLLIFVVAYLLLWPVPTEPLAWLAPRDEGLVGPFEANDRLRSARLVAIGEHSGPEDIVAAFEGRLCTGTDDGQIFCFSADGSDQRIFADTGGRPLGLDFAGGFIYVANAYLGLQRIRADGRVVSLADHFDGETLGYVDDVAVAKDGIVYFSDASSKFNAAEWGGTYAASVLDLTEHGGHGRIFKYDPFSHETTLLVDGLNFANGIAVSDDQQFLLINETGSYRIWRYWLKGPLAGESEVIVSNLPGFPDNINSGLEGKYWVGLINPRNGFVDAFSSLPFIRKMMMRLPKIVWPAAVPSTHLIAIDGNGQILHDLQDSSAGFPFVTGALETDDGIYVSSLFGSHVAVLPKSSL